MQFERIGLLTMAIVVTLAMGLIAPHAAHAGLVPASSAPCPSTSSDFSLASGQTCPVLADRVVYGPMEGVSPISELLYTNNDGTVGFATLTTGDVTLYSQWGGSGGSTNGKTVNDIALDMFQHGCSGGCSGGVWIYQYPSGGSHFYSPSQLAALAASTSARAPVQAAVVSPQPSPAITLASVTVQSAPTSAVSPATSAQAGDIEFGPGSAYPVPKGTFCLGTFNGVQPYGAVLYAPNDGTVAQMVLTTQNVVLNGDTYGGDCAPGKSFQETWAEASTGCLNSAGCRSYSLVCYPDQFPCPPPTALPYAPPPPSPVQVNYAPSVPVVSAYGVSGSACSTPIYPGGPTPFEVINGGGVVCQRAPERALVAATSGSDILIKKGQQNYVPAGYVCSGDIQITGARYYMGGIIGEHTAVVVAMTVAHSDVAGFSGDCWPSLNPLQDMEAEAYAKITEIGTTHQQVMLFSDP